MARAVPRLRVLIANERRDELELLARVVTGLGHEVIAREVEVSEVGAVTARERPDVALVGLGLSSEHALELIGEIVHEAYCPVIALLSAKDPAYIHEAAKRGVFAYIVNRDAGDLQSAIDITLQRFAEFHALQTRLQRRQKLEAVGKLAGGIAHNFNNLLTGMLGYVELALDKLPQESEARADVEEIKRSAERAANVVRGLLAFSRRQPTFPEPLDLNTIVSELEALLRQLISSNIEIETVFAPEVSRIEADRSQIEQAIVNLVLNARDAMPEGGKLLIETAGVELAEPLVAPEGSVAPGRWVSLAVRDTGLGMDVGTRERIFEPFFSTKGELGTGLGLATVFGVVEGAGGRILVESRQNEGTTFTLYFPENGHGSSAGAASTALASTRSSTG
ncbi:MAG: sensor histidine kinase [Gaiellaceae bacterium]